jgi:hypothetical protein
MKKSNNVIVRVLGSFGLCTSLLSCLFILTFFGTVESTKIGLYAAQVKYFDSYFLVHHIGPLSIPFPGALTLMGLLGANLFVGGFVRIRKSKRTVGVMIVHLGIGFMLIAGLVKTLSSVGGHVSLYEGQTATAYVSYDHWEVAVTDVQGNPANNEWVVGGNSFKALEGNQTQVLNGDDLPFDVHLQHFVPNAQVLGKGPNWSTDYPVIDGFAIRQLQRNPESGGNFAALFATVVPKDSSKGSPGTQGILWARARAPFVVEWEGRPFAIDLRRERYPLPFKVRLDLFTKEEHPRTNIPSVYSSDVVRIEGSSETPIHIAMNEPLRENGLVMFQSSWGPSNAPPGTPLFSTFAVVQNPSDKWPEIACWVIAFGMLIVFGQRLLGYLVQQNKKRKTEQEAA